MHVFLKKLSSVMAFLISPLLGIVACQAISVVEFMWPFSANPSIFIYQITFGISPLLVSYPVIVLIGIPVFSAIRFFLGLYFWPCLLGAVSVVTIYFGLFFFDGSVEGVKEYLMTWGMAGGIAVGVFVYGITFWILSGKKLLKNGN